jgi:hypothetical protein
MSTDHFPTSGQRWLSVGRSGEADSQRAGRDAARDAVVNGDARLLMAFCSANHDPVEVLAGINGVGGGVPVIGCSTRVVIGPDGPSGTSVTLVALGGPGFSVATAGAGHDGGVRGREAGAQVAECVARVEDRPNRVLVLFTDGKKVSPEDVLAGAYRAVGASVPLVGGRSSADKVTKRSFHLHGDQVLTDSVVGAVIASDGPLGIGVRHGWRRVGEPMLVTGSRNGDVFTLNDQPALKAYLGRLGAPEEAYTDPVAFDQFARRRPLGVRRRSGEEVRSVNSAALLDQGGLHSAGEVPEGGLVWLMEGDEESVLEAAGDACRDAVAALGGHPPLGLVAFDCESRGGLLGPDGLGQEVERMMAGAAGAPVAGMQVQGEFARTRGFSGYHNQTLVILGVG